MIVRQSEKHTVQFIIQKIDATPPLTKVAFSNRRRVKKRSFIVDELFRVLKIVTEEVGAVATCDSKGRTVHFIA